MTALVVFLACIGAHAQAPSDLDGDWVHATEASVERWSFNGDEVSTSVTRPARASAPRATVASGVLYPASRFEQRGSELRICQRSTLPAPAGEPAMVVEACGSWRPYVLEGDTLLVLGGNRPYFDIGNASRFDFEIDENRRVWFSEGACELVEAAGVGVRRVHTECGIDAHRFWLSTPGGTVVFHRIQDRYLVAGSVEPLLRVSQP